MKRDEMRREGIISHFLSGNNRIGGRFIMFVCVSGDLYAGFLHRSVFRR